MLEYFKRSQRRVTVPSKQQLKFMSGNLPLFLINLWGEMGSLKTWAKWVFFHRINLHFDQVKNNNRYFQYFWWHQESGATNNLDISYVEATVPSKHLNDVRNYIWCGIGVSKGIKLKLPYKCHSWKLQICNREHFFCLIWTLL